MKITISHFDTCLSCYVQDWSGIVVGVYVDGTTTYGAIRDQLETEISQHGADELESVTDEEIAAGIAEAFEGVDDSDLFDSSLDAPPSDDPDSDEYDEAAEGLDGFEAEDARHAAMREAQRAWENAETPQAWFRVEVECETEEEQAREDARVAAREASTRRLYAAYAKEREAIAEFRALVLSNGAEVVPWQWQEAHGLAARRAALGEVAP